MPEMIQVEEAKMGSEYLLCSFGCGMCTMYIPDSRTDAFGLEDKSLCCCCAADQKFCMLPLDAHGYDIVLIRSGQIKCIDPPCLRGGPVCKGVQRNFCSIVKFAVPCDEEVPFALACFGLKCAERKASGEIQWCKDDTPVDPTTNLKPMFPALSRREPPGAPSYEGTQVAVPLGQTVAMTSASATPESEKMDR